MIILRRMRGISKTNNKTGRIKERIIFGCMIIALSLFWEVVMVPEIRSIQSYERWYELLAELFSLSVSSSLISILLSCVHGTNDKESTVKRFFISACLIVGYRIIVRVACGMIKGYGIDCLVEVVGVIEWMGVIEIIHARSGYSRTKGYVCWCTVLTIITILAVLTAPLMVTSFYGDGTRYLYGSDSYTEMEVNRQFLIWLTRTVIVAIYLIALWVALCLKTEVIRVKEKRRWMSVLVRGIIYFMVLFTIPIVKIGAIPYGSIGIMREALLQSHYPFQEYFKIDSDVTTIVRVGIDYNTDVRFQSTQYSVWYGERKLIETNISGAYPGWKDGIRPQRQSDVNGIVNVEVEGFEVWILQNRIFMYVVDDEPRVFDITNESLKEDNIITEAVEKMIDESNLDVFINSFWYCCKYDYECIYPMLERYSKGNFSTEERARNADIDQAYIVDMCKRALYENR